LGGGQIGKTSLKFSHRYATSGNDDNIVESSHLCAPANSSFLSIIDAWERKKMNPVAERPGAYLIVKLKAEVGWCSAAEHNFISPRWKTPFRGDEKTSFKGESFLLAAASVTLVHGS